MRITAQQVKEYQEWQQTKADLLALIRSGKGEEVFDRMCEAIAEYAYSSNWKPINPEAEINQKQYREWNRDGSINPGWYIASQSIDAIKSSLQDSHD